MSFEGISLYRWFFRRISESNELNVARRGYRVFLSKGSSLQRYDKFLGLFARLDTPAISRVFEEG